MKMKIKKKITVDVKTLHVEAGVRYWEDSEVDGIEDINGTLIPCRNGEYWKPIIDIETGVIKNWLKGKTANIHYKVCDDGTYTLKDEKGKTVLKKEGYVPDILDLNGESFGDYIIMHVDENGKIANWNNKTKLTDFENDDDNDNEEEE